MLCGGSHPVRFISTFKYIFTLSATHAIISVARVERLGIVERVDADAAVVAEHDELAVFRRCILVFFVQSRHVARLMLTASHVLLVHQIHLVHVAVELLEDLMRLKLHRRVRERNGRAARRWKQQVWLVE